MTRLFALITVLGAIAIATHPAAAPADPSSDLQQSAAKFAAQPSVHGEEHMPGGQTVIVEFAGRDRMRVVLPGGAAEVIIGSDMWLEQNGTWQKMPPAVSTMLAPQLQQYREQLFQPGDKTLVKDLGVHTLNGAPAHEYSFASGDTHETIWIGADHLPIQLVVSMTGGTMTITYRYGGVTIEPPQ